MEDKELINLYWNRSEIAIDETDKKYRNYCKKIAYNILYNLEDSEECLNDTYLNVWKSIPDDRPQIFSAYIGKITRNLAINIYNRKRAQKRGLGQVEVVLDELENILTSSNSVEDEIDAEGIKVALNNFLYSLEKEDRIIFVKRYWYVDSIKEIAKTTGFSQSKIKSNLFRTRKKLKTYLEKEEIYL
nr:sigma-70 family RNA polymerase sigma factor [Tissierella sp.]